MKVTRSIRYIDNGYQDLIMGLGIINNICARIEIVLKQLTYDISLLIIFNRFDILVKKQIENCIFY